MTSGSYFTLTPRGGNAFHREGEALDFSDRIVNIGETPDCNIRYEGTETSEDYYASIIRNNDGESWRIVKRSGFAQILIDGRGNIGYAYQLKDGDILRFENQPMSLTFRTHKKKSDKEKKHSLWRAFSVGLLIIATALIVYLTFENRNESLSAKDVEPMEESIYMIKIDSVCMIKAAHGTEKLLATKVTSSEVPVGTAFHTTDGHIVTARHCVEYWLGQDIDLTTNIQGLSKDDVLRWAVETETFNQMYAPDSSMWLRVHFSLYDFKGGKKGSYISTDKHVHMNTDKDGIYPLADFSGNYYWRSIRPYFVERQMELDDILWIDSIKEKGRIVLACKDDYQLVENGTPLIIMGYPMTDKGGKSIIATEGTMRRSSSEETKMLTFESNITHGFSGGPVLMKSGDKVVAIGVVSMVDSISNGIYKRAVPTTEIRHQRL